MRKTLPIVVDTGAGPNLIDEAWVESNYQPEYKYVQANLNMAGRGPQSVKNVVPLVVTMKTHCTLLCFAEIKDLAVSARLGTSSLHRCVQSISPADQVFISIYSDQMPINPVTRKAEARRSICSV